MTGAMAAAALFLAASPACAGLLEEDPPIRVLIIDSATSASLLPHSPWEAKSAAGDLAVLGNGTTRTLILEDGKFVALHREGDDIARTVLGPGPLTLEAREPGGELGIHRVPVGVGWWWESTEDRRYEGTITFHAEPGSKFSVVVTLPLERYLRGVVPSEIGPTSPHDALAAQAVAARSAAAVALTSDIYSGPLYDICSDVACQVYSGTHKATTQSDEAIRATRGLILTFEGKPLSAYYASNCGGHTEDIRNVWPERGADRGYWDAARFDGLSDGSAPPDLTTEEGFAAWLDSSPAAWCNPSHGKIPEWAQRNFRWTREFTADEVTSRVARLKDIGRVTAIRPLKRGVSGRLIEVEFVGENGTHRVGPELAIRQVWQPPLRGGGFIVKTEGPAEHPEKFIIRGAGYGHGVGMCQSGAIAMAHASISFRDILAHYYPNAKVESAY